MSRFLRQILAVALFGHAVAQKGYYFVLEGGGMPLVIERADPIQSPGKVPSNHVHSIVGGNGFAASMNFAQAQTSTCSTVSPVADKSNYWMPNLYFHAKNGSFIRVPEQPYHKIYYKYGNGSNQYMTDIQEFPKEFRMIAGNMLYRSDQGSVMGPYGSGLSWCCHGSSYATTFCSTGFPTGFTSCPYGYAAAMTMPSCWNGKAFNVSDPYSHVAYPTADGIKGCPSTHRAARFPQIFIEYWLNVNSFDGLYTAQDQPFVLAQGDPTGYGYHMDFINGWDVGVLNATMPTCTPGNTGNPPLSDSTCFGKYGGTFSSAQMNACTQKPLVNENVGWTYGTMDNGKTRGGVLSALPGCNPIQPGPQNAVIMTNCTSS